jgi:type II secretory pathway component PulK
MLEDPGAKLNVNLAGRATLVTVLTAMSHRSAVAVDSLADGLRDWRDAHRTPQSSARTAPEHRNGPLADVAELRYVRGFDSALVAQLERALTTRGTGTIDLTAAPPAVLATVPGLGDEAVAVLMQRRELGLPIRSAEELVSLLSSTARTTLYGSYPEFLRAVTFAPSELVAVVEGGVRGTPIVARVTLTAVPVTRRLAVVRRETE